MIILYQNDKKNNSLCVFVPRDTTAFQGSMGACLVNKCREQRQNDVVMRMERLHKMVEGEYACRLRGIEKYSDQRGCIDIIRIYEQIIRELLKFYVLEMLVMKLIDCLFFIQWYLCHF